MFEFKIMLIAALACCIRSFGLFPSKLATREGMCMGGSFKKNLIAGLVSASIFQSFGGAAFADALADEAYANKVCAEILKNGPDNVKDRTVSCSVPSRPRIISLPAEDPLKPDNPIEAVLRLIPAVKYFKVIATEYNSRSTNYKPGEENFLSPLQ
jgi:hypothetical protein